jgi:hypothetical protein
LGIVRETTHECLVKYVAQKAMKRQITKYMRNKRKAEYWSQKSEATKTKAHYSKIKFHSAID